MDNKVNKVKTKELKFVLEKKIRAKKIQLSFRILGINQRSASPLVFENDRQSDNASALFAYPLSYE